MTKIRKAIPKNENEPINAYSARLLRLYDIKGIDTKNIHWAVTVAKDMILHGIIDYDDYSPHTTDHGKDDTETQVNNKIAKSLRNHTNPDYKGDISTIWIKRYCDYFGCSSDFLFGYIETPLHTTYDDIPLTYEAISAINSIKQRRNSLQKQSDKLSSYGIKYQPYNNIELLNYILSNPAFEYLLCSLEDYIKPEYNKPMFVLGGQESITGKSGYYIPTHNNYVHKRARYDKKGVLVTDEKGKPVYDNYLPLVKDESTPSEYRSVRIDDTFLETVSMQKIQRYIDTIKKDYLAENPAQ